MDHSRTSPKYQPLEKSDVYRDATSSSDSSEALEGLLGDTSARLERSRKEKLFWRIAPWVLHAVLLTFAIGFFLLAGKREQVSAQTCVERSSTYSPALGAVRTMHDVQFNGTIDHPSPYRGYPSPEVDAAWEHLTNGMGAFTVDSDTLKKIKQSESSVRVPEKYGGEYMASLEVFHQLHCVNLVRQYTYFDYYKNRSASFYDPPELLRTHVDHCIEMLRQKLMCDADVGVISYDWVSIRDQPWPNFNTWHKCRDFEAVFEWGVEHQAKFSGGEIVKPEGVVGLESPP
ncbi:MAG: hypothetical protein M1833_003746 [Piccolia ochrophora]|nr:MAG: hypothetical protein M1833_003746 [Piccolia ochrophora]